MLLSTRILSAPSSDGSHSSLVDRDPFALSLASVNLARTRYFRLLVRHHLEPLGHPAGGAPDREIASALQVAETTVKTHVRNILRKLGARNRAEAAARLR